MTTACLKCRNDGATEWLDKQRVLLLPVDYFLVGYTLPAELRQVARANQRDLYSAFCRASATRPWRWPGRGDTSAAWSA